MSPFFSYLFSSSCYAIAAAILVLPLIYVNIRFAARWQLVDWPKTRGINERHVPIIGYSLAVFTFFSLLWECSQGRMSYNLLLSFSAMLLMGYLDDRHAFSAWPKLICQIAVAVFTVHNYPAIPQALDPFGPWSYTIAVLFMVGIMNAVNFIDGIDGLAGIVLMAGSLGYLLLAYPFVESLGTPIWIVSLHLGTLIPFLYMNVFRRAGFLGNVGSYYFSFMLGAFHVALPTPSAFLIPKLSISVLCFLIPVADSFMVIVLRLITNRSPFSPDKGHLHHRLVRTGLNLRHILAIFASLEVSGLVLAWIISKEPSVRGTWLPFFLGVSQVVTTALLILLVEKASRRRVQDYFKALDSGDKVYFTTYRLKGPHGENFTWREQKRIEANLNTEIRVSDLCYIEAPNTVFLICRADLEISRRVHERVMNILAREGIELVEPAQMGEYKQSNIPKAAAVRKAG